MELTITISEALALGAAIRRQISNLELDRNEVEEGGEMWVWINTEIRLLNTTLNNLVR